MGKKHNLEATCLAKGAVQGLGNGKTESRPVPQGCAVCFSRASVYLAGGGLEVGFEGIQEGKPPFFFGGVP